MILRDATPADAPAMCGLINPIIAAGGTTAHRQPFDPERMLAHYIAPPLAIATTLAEDDTGLLGFQALEWSDPAWQGPDRLPSDWAVIATFTRLGGTRRGIGTALFKRTLQRARQAGVSTIDATIRLENAGGLAYYARMGFRDHARRGDTVSTRFDL